MDAVDLVQLKAWSECLCRLPATDPWRVVGALRLGTAPPTQVHGVARVVPPPAGLADCELGLVSGARVRSVRLVFRIPAITRALLDDALGPGVPLRRVGPGRDHLVAYRVVIPDAPFSCDVVATFGERPRAGALATEVTLRRHRGVTRDAGEPVDEEGWATASRP
jgi:hypothetical protein